MKTSIPDGFPRGRVAALDAGLTRANNVSEFQVMVPLEPTQDI